MARPPKGTPFWVLFLNPFLIDCSDQIHNTYMFYGVCLRTLHKNNVFVACFAVAFCIEKCVPCSKLPVFTVSFFFLGFLKGFCTGSCLDTLKKTCFTLMNENLGLDLQDSERDIFNNYRGRWSKDDSQ